MPQMGVSVAEGTVVEWRKAVGDDVARDETICEISTDKIDTEVPSPAAGRVAEILVDVGVTLARIATGNGAGRAAGAGSSAGAWTRSAGAGAAAGRSFSDVCGSPGRASVAIRASTVPVSTVTPTCTRISTSRPLAGDGTSVSILSVEISQIVSSASIQSPRCLRHSTTVPSATETPICGIVTSTMV